MRTLPNPTRSEISDIYNTIIQSIDCILLNLEIISGIFPFEVVETISKFNFKLDEICCSCEKRVDYSVLFHEILGKLKKPMKVIEAISSR